MAFSKWNNIPSLMDVKLNKVPYVSLCQVLGYNTNKQGTFALVGYAQDLNTEVIGSMYKVSGTLTTEYEQATPFIRVGRLKDGTMRARLIVPVFDYDNWALALGITDPDLFVEYRTIVQTMQQNITPTLTRVNP